MADELWEDLEAFRAYRAGVDPFGSLYAYLEGGRGGRTWLLHAPYDLALEVLRELNGLAFRGRLILLLDPSSGSPTREGPRLTGPALAPLDHALEVHRPQGLVLVGPGEGLGWRFPGGKEMEEGWRPWEAEGEALVLHPMAPTGLVYREVRAYAPWESPPLPLGLPEGEGPYLGEAGVRRGLPTYGLGVVGLGRGLEALLEAWS